MQVARNQKELENIILKEVKKQLPKVTKDYCNKWYTSHKEMKEIIAEDQFIKMVHDSTNIMIHNGQCNMNFEIAQNSNMTENNAEILSFMWEDFKLGYIEYIKNNLLK